MEFSSKKKVTICQNEIAPFCIVLIIVDLIVSSENWFEHLS